MLYKMIKDIRASTLGFGCWAIGGTWNNIDDDESILAIHTAIDYGINFFDVAPVYGYGHAETILGQAIRGQDRGKIIIATKCGLRWDPVTKKTRNDLSPKSIMDEVEKSLRRLQTDYIDLYQLHWPDPATPIHETAETLEKLRRQGKIRRVGVSNYSLPMCEEIRRYLDIATFQGLYNLLEQNPTQYHNIPLEYRTRDEVLPYCSQHDMKFLPYSPLMQGLLTGTFHRSGNFDENDERRNNPKLNGALFTGYFNCSEELKKLAQEHGVTLAQLAMHWLSGQETIGPIIAGAYTAAQVQENVKFVRHPVTPEILTQAEHIVQNYQLA